MYMIKRNITMTTKTKDGKGGWFNFRAGFFGDWAGKSAKFNLEYLPKEYRMLDV